MITLLPVHKLKKLNLLIYTLSHPLKRSIIELLEKEKEIPVHRIQEKLNMSQPVVSQHLAMLRKYKLLKTKRRSKYIFYSLDTHTLNQIIQNIKSLDL